MDKKSLAFLKKLMSTPSPSGYEREAQDVVREEIKGFCDKVERDTHGNQIGIINPEGKPRVMLSGHIDEIGFMVKYIDDEGYLYFAPVGGWDPQISQGQRVVILTDKGPIKGVIGKKPIHLMTEEDRKKVVQIKDQWIDIGAKDKKEAESMVKVGDYAVVDVQFEELMGDLVVSRGFDDKSGAFVVAETLRLLQDKNFDAGVYGVTSVQEEIGLRGAKTSAYHINPDIGIAIDVTFSTDCPTLEKKLVGDIKIGGGPVIARGPNINPKVERLLIQTAEEEGIPYQLEGANRATGTDANAIQITRGGIAAGLVSIPNRYMHTPCEIVSLSDLENVAKLLAGFIRRLTPGIDLIP